MYINGVISYLNAWKRLEETHINELQNISESLGNIEIDDLRQKLENSGGSRQVSPRRTISSRDLAQSISSQMNQRGWESDIYLKHSQKQRRFGSIDFVKNEVGCEIALGKRAFVESTLFVQFPAFVQKDIFKIVAVLIPMEDLAREMGGWFNSFQNIHDLMTEMYLIPVQHPFVIIGYSHVEQERQVIELTSEIDNYLLEYIGLSLEQMAFMNEGPSYDFKVNMPSTKKLSQEACAFANTENGGLILLGVDDDGTPVGLPSDTSIDELQLQITNTVNDSCSPVPRFDMRVFESSLDQSAKILIVRIHEIERKPCMVGSKVYVRSGPSVRAADSEEIRRLVLSSAN
jgi:hypothetical protein